MLHKLPELKPNLHELVSNNQRILVAKMLANTAMGGVVHPDLNAEKDGNTPIHIAALLSDWQMIATLLAAGSRLDIKNKDGKLAKEVAKDEYTKKTLINAELPVAAWLGNFDQVKLLVKQGRDPRQEIFIMTEHDSMYVSAIYCAAYKSHDEIVKFFDSYDSDNRQYDNSSDESKSAHGKQSLDFLADLHSLRGSLFFHEVAIKFKRGNQRMLLTAPQEPLLLMPPSYAK